MLAWLIIMAIAVIVCLVTGFLVIWSDHKLGIKFFIAAVILVVIAIAVIQNPPNFSKQEENETNEVVAVKNEMYNVSTTEAAFGLLLSFLV